MSSYEVRLVKNKQKTFTSNKDFFLFVFAPRREEYFQIWLAPGFLQEDRCN